MLAPHVGRVIIANPKQARLTAHAKIKTAGIDAAVLAKPYAGGFLPEVWVPDGRTQALRRQVSRRTQLVRQRTRIKNIVQTILHAHLVPPCPHADLFGASGRAGMAGRPSAARRRALGGGAARPDAGRAAREPARGRARRHRQVGRPWAERAGWTKLEE